ncbi:hypothetical protein BDR26DRAFT_936336 [Obelidium mucronatum]|nr:hypothetical protein BDR26DRAFT_936336 [Obelidium mucronatum]
MKPRVWVSNGKNTIAIPQESLPAVIASIEPAVADIVAACAVQPSQGLLGLPTNTPLSLHLPAGVSRSNCGLSEDCFFTVDEADSMLDPGCPLTALGLGVKSKCALVIKVEKPAVFETVAETAAKPQLLPNITAEEAYKQLFSLVLLDTESENRRVDGIPDLLYSSQIYDDEKAIGINMPVDELLKIKQDTIVLIGVSGCGKTRTCYDYGRHRWCYYFDCTKDIDFITMINLLEGRNPRAKTEESQHEFEEYSKACIRSLITGRMIVLRTILVQNPNFKPFEWFCMQRSRRSRILFNTLFLQLVSLPPAVSGKIFIDSKEKFDGRVMFDESQRLLTVLELDYRSSKPEQRGIRRNKLEDPRSFFSFMAACIVYFGFKSIWCGTHMRIRNMELMYSAAGMKAADLYVFSRFTYLKPSHILELCQKWIHHFQFTKNCAVFEEMSNFLQGRPRFFISFLHKLVTSNDISGSFRNYRVHMTTNADSTLAASAPYYFWKDRLDWTIEPVNTLVKNAFQRRLVSDTLVKLCLAFLFGDRKCIAFSHDLDLVSTCLVMVECDEERKWTSTMAEPMVLCAGINYLSDEAPEVMMDHFAQKVFAPVSALSLSPQERGHVMELIIALRFIQGWWLESECSKFLPAWVKAEAIPKPDGFLDCRSEQNGKMFIKQLQEPLFPYVLLPAVNAGPDLRYSIFSCYCKTTSTRNSMSTMYVSTSDVQKNLATMKPSNWYKPQTGLQEQCSKAVENLRLVHLRFELPDTAPSVKAEFKSHEDKDGYVICVNLESEFALAFFKRKFVEQYKAFVKRVIDK